MRKDKKNWLLGLFFVFLLFSQLALADGGPNQCCVLNHKLTEIDTACDAGVKVGPLNWDTSKNWCDPDGDGNSETPLHQTKKWGLCCVVDSIYNVTDWLFYVLMAGIAILFILAGFFFITAGGDTTKISQSKRFVLYGIIGLILALMARIIPAIIKKFVS